MSNWKLKRPEHRQPPNPRPIAASIQIIHDR
jgi:hypothetical protein